MKHVYLVGCGGQVDKVQVMRTLGNVNTAQLSYGCIDEETRQEYQQALLVYKEDNSVRPIRIMVGHSGYTHDKHLEVLKQLEKFKNENIKIVLVLSYGDSNYIESVKQAAYSIYGDKIETIESFMPKNEYIRLLGSVDIAIMNQDFSCALGNFNILAQLEKKIYLNPNGDFAQSLRLNGCRVNSVENISKETFEEFCASDNSEIGKIKDIYGQIIDNKTRCERLKSILEQLPHSK